MDQVTPLAGVWIEIYKKEMEKAQKVVTPLAGVWIEMEKSLQTLRILQRHSPCGSVD